MSDHIAPERGTQIRVLTGDQEHVENLMTAHDDWTVSEGSHRRVDGWWVGESKLRLADDYAMLVSSSQLPPIVRAISRGSTRD